MTKKEITRGFKFFLCAHFFLWHLPKNSETLAGAFSICDQYARGKPFWKWASRISSLENKVIFWPKILDLESSEVNTISIDGVDKKTWERRDHPEFNIDRKNYSKKHAHGGLKYQIVLCAQRQQCVHIYGPVRGGMGDKEMLTNSKILDRLKDGKLGNVDRGYIKYEWKKKLSWPNPHDSKEANNFKSRMRLRHETFNGRMAAFGWAGACEGGKRRYRRVKGCGSDIK